MVLWADSEMPSVLAMDEIWPEIDAVLVFTYDESDSEQRLLWISDRRLLWISD